MGRNDLVDDFSAWTNHITNAIGVNLEAYDARRVLGEFSTWFWNCGEHCFEYMETGGTGLVNRFFNHAPRKTRGLCIHLDGSDTGFCSGNLEVHTAFAIFQILKVGDDLVAVGGFITRHTHGNTSDWLKEWNASIHQG